MPPSDADPQARLPLHPLEFQVLLALSEGPAHAYAIVQSIERRQPAANKILPTNLYRRIWRLADDGLIDPLAVDAPDTTRKRKYFQITALGREVAHAEAARLRALLIQAEAVGVVATGDG